MNHKQVAKDVLNSIGGVENVDGVTHCVTRLRFNLKDSNIPKKEEVASIDGVITVIDQGAEYQVVIGPQVELVFNQVENLLKSTSNTNTDTDVEKNTIERKKGKPLQRFTSMISGIFTPLIGVLMAAGFMKGLLALLTSSGVVTEGTDNYVILNSIANAFFYFFPVFIGSSAAKYFKMNHFVGILLGCTMIYPGIITAVSSGEPFAFLGIPMRLLDYSSSVFPVIVSVWFASLLGKWLDKILPQGLKSFLIPFFTILIIVPLTLFIVGPVITSISDVIADASFAVYDFNPILAGLLLGGPWIIIVMFGLHWAFIPIFINNIATVGFDSIMGVLAANQFAIAAAAIAIGVRAVNKKDKNLGLSTGITTLLGVSEPAIYSVLLPRKKPLIMAVIGGSIGGAIGGYALTKNYSFTPAGFFGITGTINPTGLDSGFYGGLVEITAGFVVAFILTYFWGYKDTKKNELN
ncbi:PTS transporter subunit EIIC [Paenibacillus peoriae]|uniref:PTS transporter subunit EIIC n=1 Tax=Paenibacillus peoriae TaxID=59893 RepID=UPI0030D1591A